MTLRLINTNFSGGALDPRLAGRQDLRAYQNGAAELNNVTVLPFGGVAGRAGTRWLGRLATRVTPCRLIPFEFNTEQTYCLALLDSELQVWKDGVRQEIVLQDTSGASTLIDPGEGTIMSTNAGASAAKAFDGVTSAAHANCATAARVNSLEVGKTFSTPRRIAKAEVWPSNDRGYADNYTGSLTLELRASAELAPPTVGTAGDLLGQLTLTDTATGPHTIESGNPAGFYRHVWVRVALAGELHIAEVKFYAAMPATAAPWVGADLKDIYWTQSADTLLICHPAYTPRRITRTSHTVWTIQPWYARAEGGRRFSPHYKFAEPGATLQASGTTGTVTLTARRAAAGTALSWFQAAHVGVRFRLGDKEVEITAVPVSPGSTATATVIQALANTNETTDWSEEAWSPARGWPVSCCYHQDRLVIGGSRDLPNRLWLSASADLDNFALGEADDDDAIELPILTDQVNAIRGVFPGQHLQVFTSGAEFILAGEPIAPSQASLSRQTRVGSPIDRVVLPIDVDGVTVFVGRQTGMPRQMVWTYEQDAYQAPDLALLAPHLIVHPVGMVYDEGQRLVHFVNADGSLATLTSYRTEEVAAWTRAALPLAAVRSIAQSGGQTYLAVECSGEMWLERFEAGLHLDHAVTGVSELPAGQATWSGAAHLTGALASVTADGAAGGDVTPDAAGTFTLDFLAHAVAVGIAFERVIRPLAPALGQVPESAAGQCWRLVQVRFKLFETPTLMIEAGGGTYPLLPRRSDGGAYGTAPPRVSADVIFYGLGWNDGTEAAQLWTLRQEVPLPLQLLAVEQEFAVVT